MSRAEAEMEKAGSSPDNISRATQTKTDLSSLSASDGGFFAHHEEKEGLLLSFGKGTSNHGEFVRGLRVEEVFLDGRYSIQRNSNENDETLVCGRIKITSNGLETILCCHF